MELSFTYAFLESCSSISNWKCRNIKSQRKVHHSQLYFLLNCAKRLDFHQEFLILVTGDGTTGAALVQHPDVSKIAFTGSTAVGKYIQNETADRDIGLTLELGGKAANIVFNDAAIDQAVEGVVNGIFFNQGHVCCAGSRLSTTRRYS
jgi:aldehyde dehydrogenase (NAD+)